MQWLRRGVLCTVAAAALLALLAGLTRLGLPAVTLQSAAEHGPLFVLGVFVTVIGLERAVALGRPWAYAAPLAGVLTAFAMAECPAFARGSGVAEVVCLVAVNGAMVRGHRAAFTWLMLLASIVLLGATTTWAVGRPVFQVLPAWLVFFVLTIVAERLELSRLVQTPRWASSLLVGLCVALAAISCAICVGFPGHRAVGTLFIALAAWTGRYDVAVRTLRRPGLPRFAATGVLLGVGWLFVDGVLLACGVYAPAGPGYDAVVHGALVGFVMSMVFAHAPIILPAVARIEITVRPVLYLPIAVLHAGLAVRVLGDLSANTPLRRAGAAANALALGLFAASVLLCSRRSALA